MDKMLVCLSARLCVGMIICQLPFRSVCTSVSVCGCVCLFPWCVGDRLLTLLQLTQCRQSPPPPSQQHSSTTVCPPTWNRAAFQSMRSYAETYSSPRSCCTRGVMGPVALQP